MRRMRPGEVTVGLGLLTALFLLLPVEAEDKPLGPPLELSSIETEQPVQLAIVAPDGKTASCVTVKIHWAPKVDFGPNDDAASFSIDLPAENPAGPLFIAQLWSASLASAQAWQQPWQGARWKILQTPVTDGTGLDAGLAVGMIATSARRPYPKDVVVLGTLYPDGSLGAVSRIFERMDAAAAAGVTRVIVPALQRTANDAQGKPVDLTQHAADLHLTLIPANDLVAATEAVMNDPLPPPPAAAEAPKYGKPITDYIVDYTHREETETQNNLPFAPKAADLGHYPARIAAIWKDIYADVALAQQAYRAGQVYAAYQIYARVNGRIHGVDALAGQNRTSFDVKASLATADELHTRLHSLMTPPSIDKGDLASSLLVAEMADWANEIRAALEGAQLVTRQAYSARSDATEAEKDRAREAILFANEQARYLLNNAGFYGGLWGKLETTSQAPVEENAAHLLPQLIPAQLATAQAFSEGIRSRAADLRDGLLFDPQLVAYVNVMRELKTTWDARVRRREIEGTATPASGAAPGTDVPAGPVGFDPGNTYAPPHTVLVPTTPEKKLTDVAQCLIWVNDECRIATLDQKYVRLGGSIDPATHAWRLKDPTKLDALLQAAQAGARRGLALAAGTGLDLSVAAMIYERAAFLQGQPDEASRLESLRHYWRCALLGNMCWQLAHTRKAQAVDLTAEGKGGKGKEKEKKSGDTAEKNHDSKEKGDEAKKDNASPTNAPATTAAEVAAAAAAHEAPPSDKKEAPAQAPAPSTGAPPEPPVAPIAKAEDQVTPPRAQPVTNEPAATTTNAPPAAMDKPSAASTNEPAAITPDTIPVAKVARPEDVNGTPSPPATTNEPIIGPVPPAAD